MIDDFRSQNGKYEIKVHNLVVQFRLPVKKLCFRSEVNWSMGDVGRKTPPNDFLQALHSSAPYVTCEENVSGLNLFGARVTSEVRLHRMISFRQYLEVDFRLPVKKLCFRSEVTWCRRNVGFKIHRMIFFRHYLEVHFMLPDKKPCFRSEVIFAEVTSELKLYRKIFFRHYLAVHFRLPVKKLCFRFEVI